MIIILIALVLAVGLFWYSRGKYDDFIERLTEKDLSNLEQKILPPGLVVTDFLRSRDYLSFADNYVYSKIKAVHGVREAQFFLKLFYGRIFSLIIVGMVFVALIGGAGSAAESYIAENSIQRPGYGEGNRVMKAIAVIRETNEDIPINIAVPEKEPTKEQLFEKALGWLSVRQILGQNVHPQDIMADLDLFQEIDAFGVEVEWKSSAPDIIASTGTVIRPEFGEEAVSVVLTAILSLDDMREEVDFELMVSPVSTTEYIERQIALGEETVILPGQIAEYDLDWQEPGEGFNATPLILFVLMVAVSGVAVYSDLNTKQTKMQRQISLDFPEFVTKLVLLVGAGLNISRAWDRVAQNIKSDRPLDLAVQQVAVDMSNGIALSDALEGFSQRLQMPEVSKFCSMLSQNIRRGDAELLIALKQLADESWQMRKGVANKLAQEASTKLMLPLMIMLFATMAVVILPAALSMMSIF